MSVQTAATKNVSDKSSRGMSAHSSQLKHESIHAPEPKQQQKQTAAVIPEMKGDVPKEGAKEPKETAKESEETADSVDEKLLLPSDMKNQKEELIDGEKSIFGKKMDTTRQVQMSLKPPANSY
ncbi:hypothetical protein BDF14DRAFT_1745063 [Spinellus fusiger]|nr:hypothetical protein BDF14DRAFT_1745063 [Spinellus fusiger]